MGQLFILCGPPGVGKTTLLRMIRDRQLPLQQLQRLTTRAPRPEEGDEGRSSLEYEFLTPDEFAGRLARGHIANFIDWNGGLYATDLNVLRKALQSKEHFLLFEDMPSAIHLKHMFGSRVTVLLLFTDDEEELLKLEFATLSASRRASVIEWKRRLSLKYNDAALKKGAVPNDDDLKKYTEVKVARAIPDLAFMAGKIRTAEDVRVIANRRDAQEAALQAFQRIVEAVKGNRVSREAGGHFAFVLMPFRDEFNKIYRFVIKPTVEAEGITCLRGDEIFANLKVMDDVMSHIEQSALIISDISGGNPNVFFELGISMKLNKPIILISQDADAAFDVRTCRWIRYDNTVGGWERLCSQIAEAINRIKMGGSVGG